jgi:signal peptidase I
MLVDRPKDRIETPLLFKIIAAFAGLLVGVVLMRVFITPYRLADGSMEPNYKNGALVFVLKHRTPHRGDALLYTTPKGEETATVKRLIALPGDTVEVVNKVIMVNGKKIDPKWKTVSTDTRILDAAMTNRDQMKPITLKENEYFLIGDNLDMSFDSRETGPIEKDQIIGRIFLSF